MTRSADPADPPKPRKTPPPAARDAAAAGDAPRPSGLRPRRGLFITLMAAFAGWVVALLVLYVTTVYPARHANEPPPPPPPPQPSQPS
jgi:hypothetical protein